MSTTALAPEDVSSEYVEYQTVREQVLAAMTDRERAEYEAGRLEGEARALTAELVYDARIEAGYSQTELAQRVGTTQAVISRIENGQLTTVVMLLRIAKALGKDLSLAFA